jgi:glycosyltransferase involved in cell wall biosynthesis
VLRQCASALRRADVVFVQREAMLFGPPLVEWIATRLRRRPMVLDLDDPTYLAMPSPVYGRLAMLLKWPRKTESLIRRAVAVTCGNPVVAAHAGAKAIVIPNGVDTRVFHPRRTANTVPVIGWIGTHSTYPFVERLRPVFEALASEHEFRLVIIGSGRKDIDTRPWSIETEAEDFGSLDIGVYPIADDAWSAGKSGLKAIQYMAAGVPFVMSPVGVCATMGVAGETHFLATSDDEWRDALRRLLADPELRATMGGAGRTFAERHYALEAVASRLAEVIRAAAS